MATLPNIEKLIAVRNAIANHRESFSYWNWLDDGMKTYFDDDLEDLNMNEISLADCGTLACIGGITCLLFASEVKSNTFHESARLILGLNESQSTWLLIPWWPGGSLCDMQKVSTHEEALARLDHLISGQPIADYVPVFLREKAK